VTEWKGGTGLPDNKTDETSGGKSTKRAFFKKGNQGRKGGVHKKKLRTHRGGHQAYLTPQLTQKIRGKKRDIKDHWVQQEGEKKQTKNHGRTFIDPKHWDDVKKGRWLQSK